MRLLACKALPARPPTRASPGLSACCPSHCTPQAQDLLSVPFYTATPFLKQSLSQKNFALVCTKQTHASFENLVTPSSVSSQHFSTLIIQFCTKIYFHTFCVPGAFSPCLCFSLSCKFLVWILYSFFCLLPFLEGRFNTVKNLSSGARLPGFKSQFY